LLSLFCHFLWYFGMVSPFMLYVILYRVKFVPYYLDCNF
jgi:hypothetical protein